MVYIPIDIEKAVRRECKRRRYSDQTIKTYIYCINRFLKSTKKTIDKISKKDVRLFLEELSDKGRSGNTMNVYHMAIRFLFQDVLDKRMWIDIEYSRVPEKIPVVLTKIEVKSLFDVISNEKHRIMVEFMYSAGLRVSELVNMKVKDIDFGKGYGFVRGGKGNKDRLFVVSSKIEPKLVELVKSEGLKKDDFLFTSSRKREYSTKSVNVILKEATHAAGIHKNVHPHTLRHSFATHLIEEGYSVTEVQSILGHKSPETSMIYIHVASPTMNNIRSPFDSL